MIKISINPHTNNFVNSNFPLPVHNFTAEFYQEKVSLLLIFLNECIYIPRIQNGVIPLDTEQYTINYYIQQFVNTTQH
jgi:hypothetical protein